jgi:radical SAM protein (TIGR01212 family)
VLKIGLSTGIQCPQRIQNTPCIFCEPTTFMSDFFENTTSIPANNDILYQINHLANKLKKLNIHSFIAYFQDNTSLYGDIDYLISLFKVADMHPDILELIISTRPDYIDKIILNKLLEINKPVTVEIGVQTVNDKSLAYLNRGHTQQDNQNTMDLLSTFPFRVGAHIILGIPSESILDINNTIEWINKTTIIKEIKLHHLAVYKNSVLAKKIDINDIIDLDTYIELLIYFLKEIRDDIVISRLFTSNLNRHNIMINNFPGVKREWMNKLANRLNHTQHK